MWKNRDNNPKIILIENAPSKDKKILEKVERKYIVLSLVVY